MPRSKSRPRAAASRFAPPRSPGLSLRGTVAVDGQKRIWVLWSANKNGNFDIYGKHLTGDRWSGEIRLTSDPGTDLNPVAVTDAKGRVWVAWQAFRNGNLEILAAAQD